MNKVQDFFKKNKPLFLTHIYSFGTLLIGFAICRYAAFGIHGMEEWPVDLLIAGLVVQLVSLFAGKQAVPWFNAVGYSIGFWLGVIFHKEGFDPGGGRTDNLWQIWTIVFVICIFAGVVVEIIRKWRKLLRKSS